MRRRGFRALLSVLAVSGSFSGTLACGKLVDEVGKDAGGLDATAYSSGDVAVADAATCVQSPEMSECCGFGPPSHGYSCMQGFGASVCGPIGWTCPNGGSPAPGCSKSCINAPDAGLADAPSGFENSSCGVSRDPGISSRSPCGPRSRCRADTSCAPSARYRPSSSAGTWARSAMPSARLSRISGSTCLSTARPRFAVGATLRARGRKRWRASA